MADVTFARAHFTIVKGLLHADRAIIDSAPRFFEMTVGAHEDAVLMHVSRLFDSKRETLSIHTLLSSAVLNAAAFKHGTPVEVSKVVAEAKDYVLSLDPIVKGLKKRRNQTVAHSAREALLGPNQYIEDGLLPVLEGLFDRTATILNKLSQLYRGAPISLDLPDANDYRKALDLIVRGMKGRTPSRRAGNT
jgi:hypothetical protein